MWQSDKIDPQPLVGEIADVGRLTSSCSECDWAVAHTAGGTDGREEGCERGYYDLHRYLDDPLLLHTLFFF